MFYKGIPLTAVLRIDCREARAEGQSCEEASTGMQGRVTLVVTRVTAAEVLRKDWKCGILGGASIGGGCKEGETSGE